MKILQFILIFLISISLYGQNQIKKPELTANEITNLIINKTGADVIPNTVDVFKEGNPEAKVNGIVSCMFATMDVLKQAVDKGCNLIITHEPIYYNHLDETSQLQNDPVYLEKKIFITDHQLIIWRFHDYIHSMQPDGILSGMASKLGWEKFAINPQLDHFKLPKTTLKSLIKDLKTIFPDNAFYYVGNPEMQLTNVFFAAGASGSVLHIQMLENDSVDVVIAGESPQWETYEYARDAVSQGRNKAVIFLGHIPSEEAGMDFCAQWLKSFIVDIPVYFVESKTSYRTY
jgi:putative NIF3 family GTP cyclohydrolase 1 type 2